MNPNQSDPNQTGGGMVTPGADAPVMPTPTPVADPMSIPATPVVPPAPAAPEAPMTPEPVAPEPTAPMPGTPPTGDQPAA